MDVVLKSRAVFVAALLSLTLAGVTASAQTTQYEVALPHLAYGGGWQTTLLIRNTGSASATVQVFFYSNSGSPLAPALTNAPSGCTSSSCTVTVPANGQVEVTPSSSGGTTTAGWAGLIPSSDTISAQAIFVWQNGSTTSQAVAPVINNTSAQCIIPLPTPATTSFSMPFDNTNGQLSGYAFANTTNQSVNVSLTFYNESGSQIGTYSIGLAAFGHIQFLLTDTGLPAALAGQKGIMEISGAGVVPLGFRFAISGGAVQSFTTWLP